MGDCDGGSGAGPTLCPNPADTLIKNNKKIHFCIIRFTCLPPSCTHGKRAKLMPGGAPSEGERLVRKFSKGACEFRTKRKSRSRSEDQLRQKSMIRRYIEFRDERYEVQGSRMVRGTGIRWPGVQLS